MLMRSSLALRHVKKTMRKKHSQCRSTARNNVSLPPRKVVSRRIAQAGVKTPSKQVSSELSITLTAPNELLGDELCPDFNSAVTSMVIAVKSIEVVDSLVEHLSALVRRPEKQEKMTHILETTIDQLTIKLAQTVDDYGIAISASDEPDVTRAAYSLPVITASESVIRSPISTHMHPIPADQLSQSGTSDYTGPDPGTAPNLHMSIGSHCLPLDAALGLSDSDLSDKIQIGEKVKCGGYSDIFKGTMLSRMKRNEVAIKALRVQGSNSTKADEGRLHKVS
ncbi:hypothetical protein FRC03_012026 [Tulasnella sp. 419]|nr:hypothetical protein FRC03_012026 [Tulasnella sp. 419]